MILEYGAHPFAVLQIYACIKTGKRFLTNSVAILAVALTWSNVSNSLPQFQQHQK